MSKLTPAALLEAINRQHGAEMTLDGRFQGGEQGAYRIVDRAGVALVLKRGEGAAHLAWLQVAAATTAHLRTLGYPAPTYRLVGRALGANYSIQEILPGWPAGRIEAELLPDLLSLNALQAGQAIVEPRAWPAPVVDTVLFGGEGFCLLDTMRDYSAATRELLGVVQRLVSDHADTLCETRDIVHIDFTPANILVEAGHVSGVIDWEGTCSGDRAFDLATLLFYSYADPDIRRALWQETLRWAKPGILCVYMAHLILRQVEWSARHHDRATVDQWLGRAADVLRDCAGLVS